VQRAHSGGVRLQFAQALRADHRQAKDTVGMAAALQLIQAGKFALVGRDHHLAADLMRDAMLAAEGDHG
jgi:hypothetical protein